MCRCQELEHAAPCAEHCGTSADPRVPNGIFEGSHCFLQLRALGAHEKKSLQLQETLTFDRNNNTYVSRVLYMTLELESASTQLSHKNHRRSLVREVTEGSNRHGGVKRGKVERKSS